MKVFCCKNQWSYGGGLILVAANTKKEAYLTAAYDDKTSYPIEKACDWLYKRQQVDLVVPDIEKFISEFKKETKEQQ
jgi:hypothetical protein